LLAKLTAPQPCAFIPLHPAASPSAHRSSRPENPTDRVDALVWAITALMLKPSGLPRIRWL
jgi:phage terminase large subunit-like protein